MAFVGARLLVLDRPLAVSLAITAIATCLLAAAAILLGLALRNVRTAAAFATRMRRVVLAPAGSAATATFSLAAPGIRGNRARHQRERRDAGKISQHLSNSFTATNAAGLESFRFRGAGQCARRHALPYGKRRCDD